MTKPTIADAFPPMALETLCRNIKSFSKLTFQDQSAFVNELVRVHPILNIDWPGQELFRIRAVTTADVISSVDNVIWPTTPNPKPGRLHVEGHPVVYLASSPDTAMREVEVEEGSVVLAIFSPLPQVTMQICPIGELSQILRTGRGVVIGEKEALVIKGFLDACPRDKAKAFGITDAFLYELLTSSDLKYDVTSLVSQAIFRKNDAIDALLYPSCMQVFGRNIAIRRDRFWEKYGVTSVSRAKATHLASGFYHLSEINQVEGIYDSGSFLWATEQADDESCLTLDPAWRPATTL